MWQRKTDTRFESEQPPPTRRLALVQTAKQDRIYRILLSVGFTTAGEKAVRKILNQRWPAETAVRILLNVPRFAPPAIAIVNCEGSLTQVWSRINFRAQVHVEGLAELLRRENFSVETIVRNQPSDILAVLYEAKKWQADELILGLDGFGLMKRLVLESAFPML